MQPAIAKLYSMGVRGGRLPGSSDAAASRRSDRLQRRLRRSADQPAKATVVRRSICGGGRPSPRTALHNSSHSRIHECRSVIAFGRQGNELQGILQFIREDANPADLTSGRELISGGGNKRRFRLFSRSFCTIIHFPPQKPLTAPQARAAQSVRAHGGGNEARRARSVG